MRIAASSRQDLDDALCTLDEHEVPHDEIGDLVPDLGIYNLAFRDPDTIQLERTAP